MRLHKICVIAALALGISPAAALAGTHHGRAGRGHRVKPAHGHKSFNKRSATGAGMFGGASAADTSEVSSEQPSRQQSPQPNQTTPPPDGAPQGSPGSGDGTGGQPAAPGGQPNQVPGQPSQGAGETVPGSVGKILPNGLAAAPADAPPAIQQAIWAANRIIGDPYVYGGGHDAFEARGYDCSGTVSYALHGGNLLDSPLDSSSFMSWGERGRGHWFTVWTNPGHAFLVIAGLRLDTSAAGDPHGGKGPRWRPSLRATRGFSARHLAAY